MSQTRIYPAQKYGCGRTDTKTRQFQLTQCNSPCAQTMLRTETLTKALTPLDEQSPIGTSTNPTTVGERFGANSRRPPKLPVLDNRNLGQGRAGGNIRGSCGSGRTRLQSVRLWHAVGAYRLTPIRPTPKAARHAVNPHLVEIGDWQPVFSRVLRRFRDTRGHVPL